MEMLDIILCTVLQLHAYLSVQGHGIALAKKKVDQVYMHALKMNWKILTVIQYININYVPQQVVIKHSIFVDLSTFIQFLRGSFILIYIHIYIYIYIYIACAMVYS